MHLLLNPSLAGEALIALKGAVAANGFGTSKLRSWKLQGEYGLLHMLQQSQRQQLPRRRPWNVKVGSS